MKAPLSWLREYVPIEMTVEELASRLALTGTEVERVTEVGVPSDPENLDRFVVGKVLHCGRHPDADKLAVCTVDAGEGKPRTIVCGAPNVAAGQTVAVVLPGGVMPDGTRIREAKLRGVTSAGMILSEAELGLAVKSPGIIVLPDAWPPGELLADHFPLSDWVFEVEVTPNRPDCLSIRGLAREIAVITGAPFDESISFPHPWGERAVDADVAIEVHDPDLCPRYAARVIRGVRISDSPLWLKARISHAGMRPINNVVDITNYVMWTLGQPLHAFDLASVRGSRIIVRRAHPGETIVTLDNEARALTTDMLVIADAERASVVAGIMGGLDSEVTESTKDVLLECANFAAPSIMRTSGALSLRSEASTRYEKGLDPREIPLALDMTCKLLVEICGGTVSVGTIDVRGPLPEPRVLPLRPVRLEHVLGASVPVAETTVILEHLGCSVASQRGELAVSVPSFRGDLEREIDLVEEVARIHGLESIPSTLPARRVGRGGLNRSQQALRVIEDLLVGAGLSEVITYSFGDDRWYDRLRLARDDSRREAVRIANPLSNDQSLLRTMLLPGLLETARRNLAVREDRVRIFEVGRVYSPTGQILPDERTRLGILVVGEWDGDSWLHSDVSVDYYLMKGLVERLASGLRCDLEHDMVKEAFLHPAQAASVRVPGGRFLGWFGVVHPLVLQEYDLRGPAVAAELDTEGLIGASVPVAMFRDLFAYPALEQDLALVVDAGVSAASVIAALRAAGGELLDEVRIFDLYEGSQVPAGKKSLALRLSFRRPDRTLSEAEVNEVRTRILRELTIGLGAELRS